jgi:vacuolar iron transporter family protein
VPLAPMVVLLNRSAHESFLFSAALTAIVFFGIGVVRGRVVDGRPLAAGIETLFIGGSAAAVAYLVGRLLERFATN